MKINKPKKSKDIPVTKIMFEELRSELKSDTLSLQLKIDSQFEHTGSQIEQAQNKVRAEISEVKSDLAEFKSEVRSDFSKVKSDISNVKSDLSEVKSELAKVLSAVHRVTVLVEDQNERNKYVLDGYSQIYNKIRDLENNKADKTDRT